MTSISILFLSSSFSLDPNNCVVLSNDSLFFAFNFSWPRHAQDHRKGSSTSTSVHYPPNGHSCNALRSFATRSWRRDGVKTTKKNTEKASTQDNNLPSSAKRSRSARKGKGYGVLADKIRRRAWERDGREAETHTHTHTQIAQTSQPERKKGAANGRTRAPAP